MGQFYFWPHMGFFRPTIDSHPATTPLRVAQNSKNCKNEKIPPRCCFCGTTEWENINRKSREWLSTLLKAYQIYKGNPTQIQRKMEDEGKMPFWAL